MVLFHYSNDPKYQLLENPSKRCKFVAHSWAVFGLVVLCICIAFISLIILCGQIKQTEHKAETLDFVLFGPKREISDIVRFSEYRALTYALANKSDVNDNIQSYTSNESVETYQHIPLNYKLICYYVIPSRSSSQDRLYPSKIDPFLCTHIIIFFASLNDSIINFSDFELMESMIKLKLKNSNLKLLLSVVSFSASEDHFAQMISTVNNRQRFIESALQLLKRYSLDGIDLDWEFPAWPPNKDIKQKDQFVQLLKEMRYAFGNKYLLSVAVAAPITIVERSYDIPKLALYVDFINIMCYDYHSFVWYLPLTGPNAPLYSDVNDKGYQKTLNTNYTVHLWLKNGMPKNKIMVGMPTYGHSWTLLDPQNNGFNALAENFGSIGEKGFISYRDTCKFINSSGTAEVFNGNMRVPYAYKQREWFSYDNFKSLSYKAEYVTEMGVAGAMIFSLNHDDPEGLICGSTPFPLVSRIKAVLEDNDL